MHPRPTALALRTVRRAAEPPARPDRAARVVLGRRTTLFGHIHRHRGARERAL